jgi:ATP-dependent DNA helicase PIF1
MEKELSQDQKYAFDKFKKGENLFITGPGGSGKTELIKNMVNFSEKTGKKIQVCALTGCASVLLNCNARTIHSWSGIRLGRGPNDKIIANVLRSRNVVKNWKKIKVLIIDEISMMSVKIFNLLDEMGKESVLHHPHLVVFKSYFPAISSNYHL